MNRLFALIVTFLLDASNSVCFGGISLPPEPPTTVSVPENVGYFPYGIYIYTIADGMCFVYEENDGAPISLSLLGSFSAMKPWISTGNGLATIAQPCYGGDPLFLYFDSSSKDADPALATMALSSHPTYDYIGASFVYGNFLYYLYLQSGVPVIYQYSITPGNASLGRYHSWSPFYDYGNAAVTVPNAFSAVAHNGSIYAAVSCRSSSGSSLRSVVLGPPFDLGVALIPSVPCGQDVKIFVNNETNKIFLLVDVKLYIIRSTSIVSTCDLHSGTSARDYVFNGGKIHWPYFISDSFFVKTISENDCVSARFSSSSMAPSLQLVSSITSKSSSLSKPPFYATFVPLPISDSISTSNKPKSSAPLSLSIESSGLLSEMKSLTAEHESSKTSSYDNINVDLVLQKRIGSKSSLTAATTLAASSTIFNSIVNNFLVLLVAASIGGLVVIIFVSLLICRLHRIRKSKKAASEVMQEASSYSSQTNMLTASSGTTTMTYNGGNTTMVSDSKALSIPGYMALVPQSDYNITGQLAEGGGGSVYYGNLLQPNAMNRIQSNKCVVKILKLPDVNYIEEMRTSFMQEVAMMALFENNCFIVQMAGYTADPMSIIMKAYLKGSLYDLIFKNANLPDQWENIAAVCGSEIAKGIAEIHDIGVVHHDIKPANVLLDPISGNPYHVVICDFGIASAVEESLMAIKRMKMSKIQGVSLVYAGPEVITAIEGGSASKDRDILKAGDTFAYAITLYETLFRLPPYPNQNQARIVYSIKNNIRPVIPSGHKRSNQRFNLLIDVMAECWNADPLQRPSMRAVASRL